MKPNYHIYSHYELVERLELAMNEIQRLKSIDNSFEIKILKDEIKMLSKLNASLIEQRNVLHERLVLHLEK